MQVALETPWMEFIDLGKILGGVTHKYEVRSKDTFDKFTNVLGWVEWKPGWRRYIFRPVLGVSTYFDASCLTTVAEFVKLRTDERKAQWGQQGRPIR